MDGIKRLFAESKRFYFVMFILVSVCILVDCFISFGGYGVVDYKVVTYVKESLGEVEPEELFQNTYISLESDLSYRFMDVEGALLYGSVYVGILILLALKQFAFVDERTREFRSMWPVKSWVRELYDYGSVLLLIVWGILLQTAVLLIIQNRYNSILMDCIGVDRNNVLVASLIDAANEKVVLVLLYYMFSVVLMYTWIYLWTCLVKNPVVAVIGSVLVWSGIYCICDIWIWRFAEENASYYAFGEVAEYKPWFYVYKLLATIQILLSDSRAMDYYVSDKKYFQMWHYGGEESVVISSVEGWLLMKVVLLALLVIGIVLAAKKKELSSGKLLYFPKLDYILALFAGVAGGSIWMEYIIPYDVERITGYDLFTCILVGVVSAVVTFLILHPRMLKEKQCLEVK